MKKEMRCGCFEILVFMHFMMVAWHGVRVYDIKYSLLAWESIPISRFLPLPDRGLPFRLAGRISACQCISATQSMEEEEEWLF